MSSRRSGLGRGLEALIPTSEPTTPAAAPEAAGATDVPVERLEANPYQPRLRWNEMQLETLAASIREHGIIQPIIVSRVPGSDRLQIVAGERRWRAAQRAGHSSVPVIIRDTTAAQSLELALIENIQRADLNPIEEALAYRQLTTEFGLRQQDIAERVGRSRPAIANTLRLLSAPEAVRDAVANDDISAGHARAIMSLSDPGEQDALLQRVLQDDLSVRETERLAQQMLRPAMPRSAPPPDPRLRTVQGSLQRALGARVDVNRSGVAGAGRIVISFHSDDELNSILTRITGEGAGDEDDYADY